VTASLRIWRILGSRRRWALVLKRFFGSFFYGLDDGREIRACHIVHGEVLGDLFVEFFTIKRRGLLLAEAVEPSWPVGFRIAEVLFYFGVFRHGEVRG